MMRSTYPLGPLLSARKFREEEAGRATLAAQRSADEARQAAEAAKEEWRRYREWRPGEEARLFRELLGRQIPLSDLDRHRGDIHALRAAEQDRAEASCLADQAVEEADAKVEEARRRQAAAVRDTRKIEEHRRRWQRQEGLRQENAEAAELEDFPVRSVVADDDGVVEGEIIER